jgi:hypothetical protein
LAKRLTYGSIGAILILAALLGTILTWSGGQMENAVPVSLSVERRGDALRLSWNANAPSIEHANSASLWISDGGRGRRIELTSDRLKSGTFLYTPATRDVTFRLDLNTISGRGSESVHFVAAEEKDAPADEREPAGQPATPQPDARDTQAKVAIKQAPRNPAPEVAKRKPPVIPPRPGLEPTVSITTRVAPPPKYREWVERVPLVRAIQRNRYKAGDAFVAPRPVHEVTPRLPARLARELPGEAQVDLKVSIDKTGLVRAVELRSPGVDDRLSEIAANALHDWRFEPATLRGKPVSSEVLVALHFHNPPNAAVTQRQPGREHAVE